MSFKGRAQTLYRPRAHVLELVKYTAAVGTKYAAGRQILFVGSGNDERAGGLQEAVEFCKGRFEMFVKKVLNHFHTQECIHAGVRERGRQLSRNGGAAKEGMI